MDTGVREILVKALNQSAKEHQLAFNWEHRFEKITRTFEYPFYKYPFYDQINLEASGQYVNDIIAHYTCSEILSILAVARFEGIWRPE